MVPYYGDFAEDATVYILFNTFTSDDPSASVTISNLVDADIKVHKDGGVNEIVTDGATIVINFDSVTGNHLITIDTSAHSDYATGSEYMVRINGTTVDGATINAWVGAFSIERAGGVLARLETLIATIGAAGAGLSDLGGMSTGMKSEVESECNNALVAVNLDHLVVATGAVEADGSNSTTQVKTDLVEATNDHYDVMTILFTSNDEAGQSRLITGYIGASGTVSWNAALTGTPAAGSTFIIIAAGTTADAVWDEILTGSSHNISTSAGKRLRQIEESFVHASGVIATVTDAHTITLDAGAVATADYYVGDRLQITEGVGAGQSRLIVAYTNTKVCTLDSDFITNPNTSSLYNVDAADVHVSLSDADQAQGFVATYTNTTTITLDTAAVATTDYYIGSLIVFTHGTGAGQVREIIGYTNGRVVTMAPALATAVDTSTVWHIQAAVSAAEIAMETQAEMEEDGDSLLDTIRDELANGTDGLSALKTLIDAIPTTAMRGTDNAALASVIGALNDAASDGDPTTTDTLMKYAKQLINILIGTAGIAAFPSEAAPANAVSLTEVIRAIHADVTGIAGSAMRGTNNANTTVPDAAGTAPTKAEIQAEMEENGASILDTLRDDLADGGRLDLLIDAIKAKTDNQPAGIPKNVALSNFRFLMVDTSGDPKTGLTITSQIGKDGGALASATNSAAEVSNGIYEIDWTQAEMNADMLIFRFSASGAKDRVIVIITST